MPRASGEPGRGGRSRRRGLAGPAGRGRRGPHPARHPQPPRPHERRRPTDARRDDSALAEPQAAPRHPLHRGHRGRNSRVLCRHGPQEPGRRRRFPRGPGAADGPLGHQPAAERAVDSACRRRQRRLHWCGPAARRGRRHRGGVHQRLVPGHPRERRPGVGPGADCAGTADRRGPDPEDVPARAGTAGSAPTRRSGSGWPTSWSRPRSSGRGRSPSPSRSARRRPTPCG